MFVLIIGTWYDTKIVSLEKYSSNDCDSCDSDDRNPNNTKKEKSPGRKNSIEPVTIFENGVVFVSLDSRLTPGEVDFAPSERYLGLLKTGAKEMKLKREYQTKLQNIPTSPKPNIFAKCVMKYYLKCHLWNSFIWSKFNPKNPVIGVWKYSIYSYKDCCRQVGFWTFGKPWEFIGTVVWIPIAGNGLIFSVFEFTLRSIFHVFNLKISLPS